jgi:hypothetical protein
MFFVSIWWTPTMFYAGRYYPPRELSLLDNIWIYINRVDILLFIITLLMATLFTAGFAKERTYKLTTYLFIASMGLFFITFLRGLFA